VEFRNLRVQIDALTASQVSLLRVIECKKASVNPIRRLPPELLARIFEIFSENQTKLNELICVCRQWRSTLLDMPRLWTMVACKTYHKDEYFDARWPDYPAYRLCTSEDRLESILTRCKGAPIDLVIDLTPVIEDAATPPSMILRVTPDRVKNVRSLMTQQIPETLSEIVPDALTGSWDLLEEANIYVYIPSLMKSLSLSAPRLHVLTISAGIPIGEYSTASFWKQMTRLMLYGPVQNPAAVSACLCASQVLTYLYIDAIYLGGKPLTESPVLEELTIYNSQLDLAKSTYPVLKTLSISSLDPPTNKVDLPALNSLRYYNMDLATLAKLRAPLLGDLNISGNDFENAAADDIHTVWSPDVRRCIKPRNLRLNNLSFSVPKLVDALRILSPYLESLCLATPSCRHPCLWRAFLPLPAHRAEARKEKSRTDIVLLPKVSDFEIYLWDHNIPDRKRRLILDQLIEVAQTRKDAGCAFSRFQLGLSWEWNGGCSIQLNSQAEKRTLWGRDGSKAQKEGEGVETGATEGAEEQVSNEAAVAETQRAVEMFSTQGRILTEVLRSLKYGSLFLEEEREAGPSVPQVAETTAQVQSPGASLEDVLRQWLWDWL
jgi:F-box-like